MAQKESNALIPIVDAHHHLWAHRHPRDGRKKYLIEEYAVDLATVPEVVQTIFVECSFLYRDHGPPELLSLGEAEFVGCMGRLAEKGLYGSVDICAAYVGYVDFEMGEKISPILDQLRLASHGRLRGIRFPTNWDRDPSVHAGTRPMAKPMILQNPEVLKALNVMQQQGLVFDALVYFPQLPELIDVARNFPHLKITVNHCGGVVGIGPYSRVDTFKLWQKYILELGQYTNVHMKIGGMAGRRTGFNYSERLEPPTADDLLEDWGPYFESCIEAFGPSRCMFESNAPVDCIAGSYAKLWEVMKRFAYSYSVDEKCQLFHETARKVFSLGPRYDR